MSFNIRYFLTHCRFQSNLMWHRSSVDDPYVLFEVSTFTKYYWTENHHQLHSMRLFKISWSSRRQCVTHSRREKRAWLFWCTNLKLFFGLPFCDVSNHLARYICCSLCGQRNQLARGSGWKCSHFGCNLQESIPPHSFLHPPCWTGSHWLLHRPPTSTSLCCVYHVGRIYEEGIAKVVPYYGHFSKMGLVAI